ncbi:hypothetical protein R1sor_013188 [Riccia sorocarpa]|uniref:Uncharacterized protein n=1 Tax=Riccia sorocarpa TaxID=122646 RepID=A0ABD3H8M9_9MARC
MEIWKRRWIVKESTLPDTGLGVFAMDKIEVASNCTPDNLPQLFPYDNVFPDIRAFNWHRKKSVSSLLPTELGFPGQPNIETAHPGPSVETEDILTDSEDDKHEVLADFIETYFPPVAAEVDTEDNMSLPPQGEGQPLHDDAHTPLYHGAKSEQTHCCVAVDKFTTEVQRPQRVYGWAIWIAQDENTSRREPNAR